MPADWGSRLKLGGLLLANRGPRDARPAWLDSLGDAVAQQLPGCIEQASQEAIFGDGDSEQLEQQILYLAATDPGWHADRHIGPASGPEAS